MVKSIAVFTFLFWSLHSNAQMDSFSILRDKMFFNILAHKADSQVYDFVEKYFPDFNRPPVTGGWTAYPPGPFPVYQSTMHSYIFESHPHFHCKFREGRLDFVSKETKDGKPGVADLHLWFYFDNKSDADFGFKKLCLMFDNVSMYKNIIDKDGRTVAQYGPHKDSVEEVEFILVADDFHTGNTSYFSGLVQSPTTNSMAYNRGLPTCPPQAESPPSRL